MKTSYLAYGIIIGLALVGISGLVLVINTPTGMVAPGMPVEQKPMLTGAPAEYWHAVGLNERINDFFGTGKRIFPQNACGQAAEELYQEIKKIKTTGYEEYSAGTQNKFKTMIFEEYGSLGGITLIQGFKSPDNIEAYIALRKMVMTVDGWKETMEIKMSLQGKKADSTIIFNKGKIKVMDFECEF